jgi:hypothetical protein
VVYFRPPVVDLRSGTRVLQVISASRWVLASLLQPRPQVGLKMYLDPRRSIRPCGVSASRMSMCADLWLCSMDDHSMSASSRKEPRRPQLFAPPGGIVSRGCGASRVRFVFRRWPSTDWTVGWLCSRCGILYSRCCLRTMAFIIGQPNRSRALLRTIPPLIISKQPNSSKHTAKVCIVREAAPTSCQVFAGGVAIKLWYAG